MNVICAIIRRDLRLSFAKGSEGIAVLFFFVLTAALFAFAFGQDAALLKKTAAGIIWISALLSALLSLEAVYHRDIDDGNLDLLLMSADVFPVVAGKMISHWLVSGAPVLLALLVVAPMLSWPTEILSVLFVSLLAGTVYTSLLGGLGAALTAGSRRTGVLMAILILPLLVPMIILGLLAAEAALAGLPCRAYLLLQCALVIIALPLAPFASSAILNAHLKS